MATLPIKTVNLSASYSQTAPTSAIQPYDIPASLSVQYAFLQGTASNSIDLLYAATLSLAGTATNLDLTSLTDPAGGSINFARVRHIMIANLATTAGYTLTIGAASSNAWTGLLGTSTSTIVLPPGIAAVSGTSPARPSVFVAGDPLSSGASGGFIVGASSKVLKLDPGANTFSVSVLIVGTSATS